MTCRENIGIGSRLEGSRRAGRRRKTPAEDEIGGSGAAPTRKGGGTRRGAENSDSRRPGGSPARLRGRIWADCQLELYRLRPFRHSGGFEAAGLQPIAGIEHPQPAPVHAAPTHPVGPAARWGRPRLRRPRRRLDGADRARAGPAPGRPVPFGRHRRTSQSESFSGPAATCVMDAAGRRGGSSARGNCKAYRLRPFR